MAEQVECKHQLRSGCFYCHARTERPDVNATVRTTRKQSEATRLARYTEAVKYAVPVVAAGRMGQGTLWSPASTAGAPVRFGRHVPVVPELTPARVLSVRLIKHSR